MACDQSESKRYCGTMLANVWPCWRVFHNLVYFVPWNGPCFCFSNLYYEWIRQILAFHNMIEYEVWQRYRKLEASKINTDGVSILRLRNLKRIENYFVRTLYPISGCSGFTAKTILAVYTRTGLVQIQAYYIQSQESTEKISSCWFWMLYETLALRTSPIQLICAWRNHM